MTSRAIQLAKKYLALSNAHDVSGCIAMFAPNATYNSSAAGSFAGRDSIDVMMRSFFSARADIHWQVDSFAESGRTVAFDFLATHSEAGKVVRRTGHEQLTFNSNDEIEHVEVGQIKLLDE